MHNTYIAARIGEYIFYCIDKILINFLCVQVKISFLICGFSFADNQKNNIQHISLKIDKFRKR